MANDGKIYIIVTTKAPGSPTPTPDGGDASAQKKDKNKLFEHWARNRILSTAKQLATQAAMYSVNNIGNFTGNYETQANVQEMLSVFSGIIDVATTAAAGFTVTGGNPAGAAIAAVAAIAKNVASAAYSYNSQLVQMRKTNYEIGQLRLRSGLNAYADGSRGTEN